LEDALKSLNYPQTVIDRIVVNPPKGYERKDDDILIFTEIRTNKEIGDYVISGEFDFCLQGDLEDHKSTSVWKWIFSEGEAATARDIISEGGDIGQLIESCPGIADYILQGSIYRWLNPDKVTGESVQINYIFTDHSKAAALRDKKYPQQRIMSKKYPLIPNRQIDAWIKGRLNDITKLSAAPQPTLPLCTEVELWAKAAVWKYYKDPTKQSRSTKNFDNADDANSRLIKDGNVGKVVHMPGQVKRCEFCKVAEVCEQAKALEAEGRLIL